MLNLLVSLLACGGGEIAEAPPPASPTAPARPAKRAPPIHKAPAPQSVGQALDLNDLNVDRWYQPYAKDGEVTIVVFWEVWCPHCRREVPKLTALDGVPGVEVVGLTRQTKGVTDADVEKFLADHDVTYAVGHTDDQLSRRLKIRGIPFAVVVDDGKIVWEGNPAGLNERKLREWL